VAKKKPKPSLRLEWVDADTLRENPANWRRHSKAQIGALRGALSEVGWAGALLYNERTKRLIDGHARKQVATGKVPVLIGSWSEADEKKILATLDPLAAMADTDAEALDKLLAEVATSDDALAAMLADLNSHNDPTPDKSEVLPAPQFIVLIECGDENEQTRLLKRFQKEGLTCRALIS